MCLFTQQLYFCVICSLDMYPYRQNEAGQGYSVQHCLEAQTVANNLNVHHWRTGFIHTVEDSESPKRIKFL